MTDCGAPASYREAIQSAVMSERLEWKSYTRFASTEGRQYSPNRPFTDWISLALS